MFNITPDILVKRRSVICVFLFFLTFNINGQQISEQKRDSLEKDSLRLYKKIKHFAYKHKATTWLYDAIFVDPEPKEYPTQPASTEEKNVNPYLKYKNCIIREINIKVLDPFGHSIYDTLPHSTNGIQRAGNRLHITTRHWIIINRLLFEKNDTIDALAISETERILRQSVFVNDARIYLTETKSKDSVDVNIIVQDKWPVTVPILITDVSGNIRFRNQNLFGLGQQFEQYAGYRKPGVMEFNGFYNIANIDNTYISSQLAYRTDITGTQISLGFDRAFFSPLSKWAGGLSLARYWRYYSYTDSIDSLPKRSELNLYGYDVWAGRSFKLSDEKSIFNQSTNIITGIRYYNSTFIERPPFTIDKVRGNENTNAIVGNVGFAIQQYYKDKFVYRFGATEDVPEGLIIQFIYGGIKKEFKKLRYYAGMEVARAKHFKFGYLSTTISHGIFFNRYVSNDITTNLKFYYFSDLKRIRKWFFRQFFNLNITHGENKLSNETLTLYPDDLYGYDGTSLTGNTKAIFNSETVAYAPYNIIGFRFAPIFMAGMGMIGDPVNKITDSRLYQSYSLGIMVRNENLLSSTFQFSVGMYPFLPDGKNYAFKYNPVTSFTLRVRVFAVSRPEFVSY